MKRSSLNVFLFPIILICSICLSSQYAVAQPSYIDVLTHFFKKYDHTSLGLLSFEKRKDGWYVITNNEQQPEKIDTRALFWDATINAYLPLNGFLNKTDEADDRVKAYLGDAQHSGDWYNFERCRYFGYDAWQDDVIDDYKNYTGSNDTLLESLARAYGNMVNTYLWYQQGGINTSGNPLREPLKPGEPVSRARIDSVIKFLNADIAVYQKLAARSPAYPCLVGAATTKYNNELFYAWFTLRTSGYEEEARKYFDAIHPDTAITFGACNLLRSCPQDAILFTYGDNETYFLWYVQEKLRFRTDVSVINTSLLGVPRYIDYLKKSSVVGFSAAPEQYRHQGNLITYLMTDEQAADKIGDIRALVAKVLTRKGEQAVEGYDYLRYNVSGATMPLLLTAGKLAYLPGEIPFRDTLLVETGRYLYLNQLLILDIMCSNIDTRPVLYSSDEEKLFPESHIRYGVANWVLPAYEGKGTDTFLSTTEYKYFRQYVEEKFVTPPLPKVPDLASRFVDYILLRNQSLVIRYAQNNKLPALAQLYFDKAQQTTKRLADDYCTAYNLMVPLLRDGKKAEAQIIGERLVQVVFERYKHPNVLNGYTTRQELLTTLSSVDEQLSAYNVSSAKIAQLKKQVMALQ